MLNVAPCHDPEYPLQEVTHDATDYYLREGEAPGRWWGAGATAIGLAGEVEASALRDLFAGKNPSTGGYLVSARGSSARSNARHSEADLDVAAVAARLGWSAPRGNDTQRPLADRLRGRRRVPHRQAAAHMPGPPPGGR